MRKILCFCVLSLLLFSLGCKKKKVENKVDGLWQVVELQNKYATAPNAGTCEFRSGGTGSFHLNFYDPQSMSQVIIDRDFKWKNTRNTITILFDNDTRLAYRIEHLSKTTLRLNSGDPVLSILHLYKP